MVYIEYERLTVADAKALVESQNLESGIGRCERRSVMNTKGIVALIAIGTSASLITTGARGDLIANGGFEAASPPDLRLPASYATWAGDISEVVTAQNNIIPFEGTRMVHFMYTTAHGPEAGPIGCELWQIIDISAYRSLINTGNAVATAEGWFNRVDSEDPNIDTQFSIVLRAYSGSPSEFPGMWNRSELALSEGFAITDSNIRTWEVATTSLLIPVNADFLVYRITSTENVFDDAIGTEFAGHYGDGFTLNITEVPAPASLSLLLGGTLSMGMRRRRRGA